jgi:hypothetical protein
VLLCKAYTAASPHQSPSQPSNRKLHHKPAVHTAKQQAQVLKETGRKDISSQHNNSQTTGLFCIPTHLTPQLALSGAAPRHRKRLSCNCLINVRQL